MKIKQLLNAASLNVLRKMKKPDLQKVFRQIDRALKGRRKTFEKHGLEDKFRGTYARGLGDAPDTRNELISDISEALSYMRTPESTYMGYRKKELDRFNAYKDTIESQRADGSTRRQFEDIDDFREFGDFMEYAKMKTAASWEKASDEAVELFEQARRLGIDPSQLDKNFDYWREHLKELSEADPITWQRTGRKVYASDYARKLGLPPIRSYVPKKGDDGI